MHLLNYGRDVILNTRIPTQNAHKWMEVTNKTCVNFHRNCDHQNTATYRYRTAPLKTTQHSGLWWLLTEFTFIALHSFQRAYVTHGTNDSSYVCFPFHTVFSLGWRAGSITDFSHLFYSPCFYIFAVYNLRRHGCHILYVSNAVSNILTPPTFRFFVHLFFKLWPHTRLLLFPYALHFLGRTLEGTHIHTMPSCH